MAVPQVPQNVVAQQGNGQVLVSWNLMPGATSYKVQRSIDQLTYATIATPTAIQYLDTSVTVGVQYYYQVIASNGSGDSLPSIPVSVIPARTAELSLGELRERSKQRADRVHSQFVTDEEWNRNINQSYFELYDILVQKYGNEYFVAPIARFTTTGDRFYPLPDGVITFQDADNVNFVPRPFYKLLGIDLILGSTANGAITLSKFEFISRNRYVYPQITTNLLGIAGMRYRTMGNNLEFIPTPQGGQIIGIWYIPRMVELLKDTDIADGVSGWTEYIIVDAAIKALQKEESDVSVLMAQKQALIDRIEAAAENRDAGEPEKISDTRRYSDLWGFGNPGGDGNYGGFSWIGFVLVPTLLSLLSFLRF